MSMSLVQDIRTHLARYLAHRISLDEFDAWLAAVTWNVGDAENREAQWLADEIMLRLAEFSHGHWSEAELREHLSGLQPSWFRVESPVVTGSTITGQRARTILLGTPAAAVDLLLPLPATALPFSRWWFPPARSVSENSAWKVITERLQLTASP